MARRRPSSGGGAAALAKYFLLVWAVALGALVVLHEQSLADEVRRDWAAVEGEVRRDWAVVEGEVRKEWAVVEGAVEREAHYLLDGMKAPPPTPSPQEHRARKRMFATPPPRVATSPPRESCASIIERMRYWSRGETHASPYASYGPSRKYLTFEPDAGGWNNIRMAFETLAVLAHATGRVLVMPPPQRLYLLKVTHEGNKRAHHGVDAFLDFDALRGALEVISISQFLNETIQDVKTRTHLKSLAERATNGGVIARRQLREWMRRHADVEPRWAPLKECVAFGPCSTHNKYRHLTADKFCTHTRRVRYVDQRFAGAPWVHMTTNASHGYRMFTHWYTFLLFDDGVTDLYYKRFGRDRLKYKDEVFCAAGRVVDALSRASATGKYQAAHIRRGELQFVSVRISCEEWRDALLSFGYETDEVLFVLTDEKDKTWFAPLEAAFAKIYYLRDFAEEVADLYDPNALGMVEQVVASAKPCRLFTGTFFSTFSGYVARLRAYYGHAADTFFYAAPKAKHRVLHDTSDTIHAPFYNREWALAWNNLEEPLPKDRPPVWPLPAVVNVTDIKARKERYPKDTVARIKAADAAAKKAKFRPPP